MYFSLFFLVKIHELSETMNQAICIRAHFFRCMFFLLTLFEIASGVMIVMTTLNDKYQRTVQHVSYKTHNIRDVSILN